MQEMFSYNFMKLALLAIIIMSPLFGILGTMIVNRKMAFFSDALGHSALTGIAVGVICGLKNTTLSMVIFAIVFAVALNAITEKALTSNDTIISVFSSASLALGLAILSRGGNFSNYSALLVGDVLSITKKEIGYLAIILVITLIFWVVFNNQLTAISLNRALAKSKNMKVRLIENLFAILVALVVMLSIKWVGILIINAMLILPAATAANISKNMREYHGLSIVFALFSGILGLVTSYFSNVATGPMIVVISSLAFFGTYVYGKKYQ